MPCSRKTLAILTCAAFVCAAASTPKKEDTKKDDPSKKEKADFLKKQDEKKSQGKKQQGKAPETKPSTPAAPAGEKKPGEEPPPAVANATPLPKLSVPLPVGQDSIDVTIPYKDNGTGKKTMNFKIGVGTRVDEDHLKMKNLEIETYDEAGASEMTISLPGSVLDLNTRIISGAESVTIKRADFQLTGKTMTFNTETRQGWVKGDVKMIIYDLTEETGTEPSTKKEQGS
jgi:hypothetical protein